MVLLTLKGRALDRSSKRSLPKRSQVQSQGRRKILEKTIGVEAAKGIEETKETGNNERRYHLPPIPFFKVFKQGFLFSTKSNRKQGNKWKYDEEFFKGSMWGVFFF